ncbi:hypothetical protein [Nocardia camponoti]|uniref:Lipoprotein n=1 Tax=Nocardia camponoti TaxID=1616106 RepID=A0A917Q9H5_9NOCA|nr:hypothetical protein [Nocardia camponoti]GGK38514.1 hypothetical protein GCM10011591_07800 [Nocardia camponoti]
MRSTPLRWDKSRRQAAAMSLTAVVLMSGLAGCAKKGFETEPPAPTEPVISTASVNEVCGIFAGQKGTWKAIGPSVARVAFLGAVRLWTTLDLTANAAIAYNRGIVDERTSEQCPEVRAATLSVLNVSKLETVLNAF